MKFGFVSWNWKSHIDAREVSNIQKIIDAPTVMLDLPTGCDSYLVVIYEAPCALDKDDWCGVQESTGYADFNPKFEITSKTQSPAVFEATEEELRAYLAETKAMEEEEETPTVVIQPPAVSKVSAQQKNMWQQGYEAGFAAAKVTR